MNEYKFVPEKSKKEGFGMPGFGVEGKISEGKYPECTAEDSM
jgi:hypothetical protein